MMRIKTPKKGRIKQELDKLAPKLVELGKKTLILHGTKTSNILNSVLAEIYHLKKDNSVKYARKNDNIRPFESGGGTSLEFYSLKTDCSLFVFGSHSKKRPNNLVVTNLNLTGLDRAYVCTALSSNRIFFPHCALRLKKSGTVLPRMELIEVGPSVDMVVRRHRQPDDSLRKGAMRTAPEMTRKKLKKIYLLKSLVPICILLSNHFLILGFLYSGEKCRQGCYTRQNREDLYTRSEGWECAAC